MINIERESDCSGCHACQNACPKDCIQMCADGEGFLYPKVDTKTCIDCGICENVCPIINRPEKTGSVKETFAVWSLDEDVRKTSSSGGVFKVLAEKVITANGVVFGAKFNEELEVVHTFAETLEEIEQFKGSKYVQSEIGNNFSAAESFLKNGRSVLFSGTPCQINGLINFLGKPYDNLVTVDFACHGVPSPAIWQRYKQYHESLNGSKVRNVSFRFKKSGWKNYYVSFEFADKSETVCMATQDDYMKAFLADLSLRPSCYDCRFKGTERVSDITLADFWGVQNVLPQLDDDKGTSLVIVNSSKGERIIDSVKDRLFISKTDLDKAVVYNKAMVASVNMPKEREKFFEMCERLPIGKAFKKVMPRRSLVRRILKKIKTIIIKP